VLIFWIAILLIAAKWLVQLWLERLNEREVRAHSDSVPPAFRETIDESAYKKAVAYTLAKGRFSKFELGFGSVLLILVLASGILPSSYKRFVAHFGSSVWAMGIFMVVLGIAFSILDWPLEWYEQFHLEETFGFNTSTPKTWWMDRAKGIILGFVLGVPLLALVLKIVSWTGPAWWLWAWAAVLVFQLLMLVLAPIVIMPLFNKFTPLPEGALRERLLALGKRTGFHAKTIQVMDGSKRSKHSNAFFTGFGRFRKIVLFDTLIQQLAESELEAVLAHEIAHYKKKHIPKMLGTSAVGLLVAFFLIAKLAEWSAFYHAFGFEPGSIVPALILFSFLSGSVTFWLSPVANIISRRFEYQADAYARETMGEPSSLIGALRKLNEKNLSNLTPHKLYSGFYYSHPTLLEREAALLEQSRAL
jgi:STE24 endopeptidase